MEKHPLGTTGLAVAPIVFGSNVFGWTLDEKASFEVLDAFVDHGFNAIDTADVYPPHDPGRAGETEAIIGRWLKVRPGVRDKLVIFTKVGWDHGQPGRKGLSKRWIAASAEGSLRRLGVDAIDVYFSHVFDGETPQAETLAAFDDLRRVGKVKAIGASHFDAAQLRDSFRAAEANGLTPYQVLQPLYNLHDRAAFEDGLRDLAVERDLGVVTWFSLASGFLTGKYRSKADLEGSQRGPFVEKYLDARGQAILEALDQVAEARSAKSAEVALAWLIARKGVSAPIASATTPQQVESFAKAASLRLSGEEVAVLDEASA